MRIDIHNRKVQTAAGAAVFAALVAWLVPPTTPQSQPSPLLAYAKVDAHRDDAGQAARAQRTTVWSAAAWKRWYAGEPATPPPPPAFVPPAPAAPPRPARPRIEPRADRWGDVRADRPRRWDDDDWEAREADRRRWLDERAERDARREAEREERQWEREQARRDRAEERAWDRRQRIDERMPYPDDDPAYEGDEPD